MAYPAAFWPGVLGILFLVIGVATYWRDFQSDARGPLGLAAFGPVFVASALAAFAGEHFSSAAGIASIVPKWIPGKLFIAYFVGAAHLAAALSFVAKRYVRWSALSLAIMFALFVLLMDVPAAVTHPAVRMAWSLAARQATFSIGALALFATVTRAGAPRRAATLATVARLWTAAVLVYYGIENIVYPQFAPGVPSTVLTPAGVPLPTLLTLATGMLLVACGIAMFAERIAGSAAILCGLLVTLLTAALYTPQWIIARGVSQQVNAINFVFDTLLFAGTVLVVGRAIAVTTRSAQAGRT